MPRELSGRLLIFFAARPFVANCHDHIRTLGAAFLTFLLCRTLSSNNEEATCGSPKPARPRSSAYAARLPWALRTRIDETAIIDSTGVFWWSF
jgi:hypothetical protein